MFTLYLDHFLREPPGADAFYETIGRITVLWGRLENTLDGLLIDIVRNPYSSLPPPDEMPVSFSKKIALLRERFNADPPLEEIRDLALRFARQAAEVAKARNAIMHAAIGRYENNPVPGAPSLLLKHQKQRVRLHRTRLSQDELEKLMQRIAKVYALLSGIAFHCNFLHAPGTVRLTVQPEGVETKAHRGS